MNHADPHNEEIFEVIDIPSTLAAAKEPEARILRKLADCGYDEDATFAIKLALEEAMTNAVRHGNGNDASKRVVVRFAIDAEQAIICVRDEGCGFKPEEVPDPTSPDRISLPCGRGIMLIKAYMNDVEYRADGREVRMVKINRRPANETSDAH